MGVAVRIGLRKRYLSHLGFGGAKCWWSDRRLFLWCVERQNWPQEVFFRLLDHAHSREPPNSDSSGFLVVGLQSLGSGPQCTRHLPNTVHNLCVSPHFFYFGSNSLISSFRTGRSELPFVHNGPHLHVLHFRPDDVGRNHLPHKGLVAARPGHVSPLPLVLLLLVFPSRKPKVAAGQRQVRRSGPYFRNSGFGKWQRTACQLQAAAQTTHHVQSVAERRVVGEKNGWR